MQSEKCMQRPGCKKMFTVQETSSFQVLDLAQFQHVSAMEDQSYSSTSADFAAHIPATLLQQQMPLAE